MDGYSYPPHLQTQPQNTLITSCAFTYPQHHCAHAAMSTPKESLGVVMWSSMIDLSSRLYPNSNAGNESKLPRIRASCSNLCCMWCCISGQCACVPDCQGASSNAVWGMSKNYEINLASNQKLSKTQEMCSKGLYCGCTTQKFFPYWSKHQYAANPVFVPITEK